METGAYHLAITHDKENKIVMRKKCSLVSVCGKSADLLKLGIMHSKADDMKNIICPGYT